MSESSVFAAMLFSSSRGNSCYLKNGKEEYLIDAGVSARSLEAQLHELGTSLSRIQAIFLTHEHSDHICGLKTISRHYAIPIYAPVLSGAYLKKTYPEIQPLIHPLDDGGEAVFGETSVRAFATPHDANGSVCFRIALGHRLFGYATDIGHVSERVLTALTGCDATVIESNHDLTMLQNGPYPMSLKKRISGDFGHLSNASCAALLPYLVSKGAKRIVLAHLSPENNRPELAFNESYGALSAKGITLTQNGTVGDLSLAVAPQAGIVRIL